MPSPVLETLMEVAPLFAGCTPEERAELWKVALDTRYQPEEMIIQAGQVSHKLFVLAEGTVEILEPVPGGPERVLATLIPPASFGEVAFFEASAHEITARALTDVHLLSIDRSRFDTLIRNGSLSAYKVAHNVLLQLGTRLRRMDGWLCAELRQQGDDRAETWLDFRAQLYQE